MSFESPTTYADWFWGKALDKDLARSSSYEKTLLPAVSLLIDNVPDIDKLPPYIASFLNILKTPTAPDWDTCWVRFLSEVGGAVINRVTGHEIKAFDYHLNAYLQNVLITPDVANNLMLRKKITPALWLERQNKGGLSEIEATFLYESQKPYPSLPDIITYARYHGDPINPKGDVWKLYDISPNDWDLWNWLSIMKLNTEQVQSLYRRKFFTTDETRTELSRLGWQDRDLMGMFDLAYTIPNAMLLVQGDLLQEAPDKKILDDISIADISPQYAPIYFDAVLTKPSTTDIITYELRQDPNLSNLHRELRKIGIHPNYFDLYKELAYQIPPVADIITMAVREAFTPEIASRFGQYEDLPREYVKWVGKKGLSEEWAERYWAAHWSLPSPQQGFEMLHRGIITQDELRLLLRALDIMPFWRDKLIQISYNPLTRVDIRRMYNVGVLSESDVYKCYLEIGYNDLNAKRLTAFTVALKQQAETKVKAKEEKAEIREISTWTASQTLSFLKRGLITQERAKHELLLLGYNEERVNVYLSSVTQST